MEKVTLMEELDGLAQTQGDIICLLDNYFFAGNFEHQVGLLSNAVLEVINKGVDDTDVGLDLPFTYTNRYIRESVQDLCELQKFLTRLHIVYSDYKKRRDSIML